MESTVETEPKEQTPTQDIKQVPEVPKFVPWSAEEANARGGHVMCENQIVDDRLINTGQ